MIEDIKHWKGSAQFKIGYERALNRNKLFSTESYLNANFYSQSFIEGYKRGMKRFEMEELILGGGHDND